MKEFSERKTTRNCFGMSMKEDFKILKVECLYNSNTLKKILWPIQDRENIKRDVSLLSLPKKYIVDPK